MIVFDSVCKSFGAKKVLDQVSFRIEPGEFVCITGPSGAGKSTIIHLLIKAELPTSGAIEVDGVNLMKLPAPILQLYRRRTGVLFQDYKLLNDRTVYENVTFPMEVCGDSDELIVRRVPALLEKLGLTDRADAFPRELSGGEKARTALARALVHHPMILIADEPTGNIDPRQSMELLELLKQVNAEGTTVILASHDQVIIDVLQRRVLRLENGRLVRDAIGGYDAVPRQSHGAVPRQGSGGQMEKGDPVKHKIFEYPDKFYHPKKSKVELKDENVGTEEKSPVHRKHRENGGSGHIKPVAI